MFSILSFILMVHLSICEDNLVTELPDDKATAACRKQNTYAIASKIKQPLTVKLYYHAGTAPDMGYLMSMCDARAAFPEVTFMFFVGDSVKQGKKGLECLDINAKPTSDCRVNIAHACASKLVNFTTWVCCTTYEAGMPDCIKKQDKSKLKEFEQCEKLQDPQIKPIEILLNNAKASDQIHNPKGYKPVLLFNDNLADKCTLLMFFEDPVKVIKALLKKK